AAGRAVNQLPVDEVGLQRHVGAQLPLDAGVQVMGARGREVVRVERAERIGLLRQEDLRLRAGAGVFRVLLRAQRRQLRQEGAVVVGQRVEEGGAERLAVRR